MLGTILTGAIFGGCAVAALIIMKRDHSAEHRARKQAIDEATEPWRALYADKEAELGAIAAKMNRLARDLRGIADRLSSDGVKIEMLETRTKRAVG
jgi:hypothetical protein